jgi:hypothetical protein
VNDIELKVRGILLSDGGNRLKRLLKLEKERRGVPQDALVFVGMADVAEQRWCEQKAVVNSRARELRYFAGYLFERIVYGYRLGFVTDLPESDMGLLDTGNEVAWENVEQLLQEEAVKEADRVKRSAGIHVTWPYRDYQYEDGQWLRLINPQQSAEERRLWQETAAEEGIKVIDLEKDPKLRGEVFQEVRAERYPTISWYFPWRRYSVGGGPDGLTNHFAYEYKTTRSRFLFQFMKPVALAQADLYGYFFRRPTKRVQIHIVEENVTETYEVAVNVVQANSTLSAFARVDAGEPARPPKVWKCNKCDFRNTCPISQAT